MKFFGTLSDSRTVSSRHSRTVKASASLRGTGLAWDLALGRARFMRHFHDPLRPWDSAGLPWFLTRFESSVRWMQRLDQGNQAVGGNWSWQDARQHYLNALTSSDPT